MYISINWIKDFVDLEGIDVERRFRRNRCRKSYI